MGIRGISQEWEGARSLIRGRTDPQERFMSQVSFLGSIWLDLASHLVKCDMASEEGQSRTPGQRFSNFLTSMGIGTGAADPQIITKKARGGAWDSASVTNSKVMLKLLVHGPHFK